MKEDNHVRSGKSSGKDSRMYVLNQIKNKENMCYRHILKIYLYSCMCTRAYLYCRQVCYIKLSENMRISPHMVVFSQMIIDEKKTICMFAKGDRSGNVLPDFQLKLSVMN